MTDDLRINSDRMLATFNELAAIGATEKGGVHRPTFSEAHISARRWFQEQVERSGLIFNIDGAGNHSAVLEGETSKETCCSARISTPSQTAGALTARWGWLPHSKC